MALRKIDLVEMIYSKLDIPKKECVNLVESFFDIIRNELAKGNDFLISGFGKWSVKQKRPRTGRNPHTGEKMIIDSRRVVTFKGSPLLRSGINEIEQEKINLSLLERKIDGSKLLSILTNHFEKNGWPGDMNDKKLSDRASFSEEEYKAGWGIVEIERHRAILGASYRKGLPMPAFETYWMRYAVNPETGEVEEIPDESGEISINDISGLVDEALSDVHFSIKRIKKGKYLLSEMTFNHKREISSFKEARVSALELATELGGDFQMMIHEREISIPDKQLKELSDEYKEFVRSELLRKVEDAWEGRDG